MCKKKSVCMEELSNGKGDVFIERTAYYMAPIDQSVILSQPLSQDGFFIISPYNCSIEKAMKDSIPVDILDTLKAFSYGVWNMFIVTFFILSLLVYVHSMLIKSYRDYGIWTVFNHFFMNPSYKVFKNLSSKLVSISILISVLLIVILHIKNVIITDRVKMSDQKVYKSFLDIVTDINSGNKILNIFYKEQSFLPSELNNPPYNIVRQSMKSYIGNIAKSIPTFEQLVTLSTNLNNVIIGGLLTTAIIKYHGCRVASAISDPKKPDICLHRTSEVEYSEQAISGIMVTNLYSKGDSYIKFQLRYEYNINKDMLL